MTFKFECQGWDGGGGEVCDTNTPPPPTPYPLKVSHKVSCCQNFFWETQFSVRFQNIKVFLHSDGPLWHNLRFCDFRFKYLANLYYVGTTNILHSTFSFESVHFFPSYVYDIVTFKFECQGWDGGGGRYVTQTPPHHHHPTPSNFLLRCHAVKISFGKLSFV